MWYRLASHLHMPLQEVQTKTTVSEFFMWQKYFEWDMNNVTKTDTYLAQLAAEMRRSFVKNPKTVQLKSFFLKFVGKKKDKDEKSPEEKMNWSKQCWGALLGKKEK